MSRRIPAMCLAVVVLVGGCLGSADPSRAASAVADPVSAAPKTLAVRGRGAKTARAPAEVGEAGGAADSVQTVPTPSPRFVAMAQPALAEVPPGSVRLLDTATVFIETDGKSRPLGLVAAGTRVSVLERVVAPGCPQAWLGIAPRGYVCATFEDTARAPSTELLPRVPGGKRIPGTYGRVAESALVFNTLAEARAGLGGRSPGTSLMVRRIKRVSVGGRSYWKTRQGWIAASAIRRFGGSRWQGVQLVGADTDGPELPLGWARPEAMLAKVAVKASPRSGAKVLRWLDRRERVALATGVAEQGYYALREGGGFVAKARLTVAAVTERPAAASGTERWLDIDVSAQTLVAYEGDVAVYATLISSGKPGHGTPTGVFRLSRKVAERTMNSMADSKDSYSVAKVPWTAYFATGYALHAAYWHDGFGHRKSHGCVNLSPLDARALYAWTAPLVSPGWTEVYGHEEQPGSVVQIRSRRDRAPSTRGYAAAMMRVTPPASMLAMR